MMRNEAQNDQKVIFTIFPKLRTLITSYKSLNFYYSLFSILIVNYHPPSKGNAQTMLQDELLDIQINSEDEKEIIEKNTETNRPRRGRAKKSNTQQQSRCGCGNVYSCSSALSLHIKNKHGGQVPEGSVGFPSANYRRKQKSKESGQSQISKDCSQQTQNPQKRKLISENSQNLQNDPQNQSYRNGPQQSEWSLGEINSNYQFDDELNDIFATTEGQAYHQNNSEYAEDGYFQERKAYHKKLKGNKDYVSKRIYFCGGCYTCFGFLQELMLHINKIHKGDFPDGSIFGLKREPLFKFFHINTPKTNPNRRYYLFKCGCGKEYSCSSSLYYHIKKVHDGSQPCGTFGTVKPAPSS